MHGPMEVPIATPAVAVSSQKPLPLMVILPTQETWSDVLDMVSNQFLDSKSLLCRDECSQSMHPVYLRCDPEATLKNYKSIPIGTTRYVLAHINLKQPKQQQQQQQQQKANALLDKLYPHRPLAGTVLLYKTRQVPETKTVEVVDIDHDALDRLPAMLQADDEERHRVAEEAATRFRTFLIDGSGYVP
jgi:hypothetical protein